MKHSLRFLRFLFLMPLLLVLSCDDETNGGSTGGQYVILTANVKFDAGYYTTYPEFPTGTIERTNSQSLQVNNTFGYRSFGKWIFNMANTAGEPGLQKYSVSETGAFVDEGFIPEATQFLIVSETVGYYLDETRGSLKIQTLNPTTMQRTGEIDLSSLRDEEVEYQVAGRHILAFKDGKLYAGITYGTLDAQGFGDDVYNFIEFAVINGTTNVLEKTIKYEGLRGAGWGSSGNQMWSMGDDGALYIYSPGLGVGMAHSAVIRIKKNETEFDKSWILKISDYVSASSIVTGLVRDGKFYMEIPSEPLADNYSNLQDIIFDYYAVDLATGVETKITGMPQHHYAYGNNFAITEIDDKIYFWVRNYDEKVDGYYVLNNDRTSATQVFNINHDGFSWGLTKLDK